MGAWKTVIDGDTLSVWFLIEMKIKAIETIYYTNIMKYNRLL